MKKSRAVIWLLLMVDVILVLLLLYVKIQKRIPERLYLYENSNETFDFSLPVEGCLNDTSSLVVCNQAERVNENISFDFGEPFSLYAKEKGSCSISLKLLGIVPLKKMDINVIGEQWVYPGGEAIGIKIDTNGILVLGTGVVTDLSGNRIEPAKNIVRTGDYIKSINGVEVTTKEELMQQLNALKKEKVVLGILRAGNILTVMVRATETEKDRYKLGIWVRDDTQGIGTLTYAKEDREFGALGHGINDVDTGLQMEVMDGYICKAGIYEVVKGEKGNPGELVGYLKKEKKDVLGRIEENTRCGVKGYLYQNIEKKQRLKIGLKQEVHKGKAYILCQVTGEVKSYEVDVQRVAIGNEEKGIVLRVTDPKLLRVTNGIVQGMSGSPIIQDGKLVGAVTHVFVQDPKKGYGTFVEEMLGK